MGRVLSCNHPDKVQKRLHDPAVAQKKMGYILLLTDKYETSPKYASLAYQYRDHFIFGESRGSTLIMAQHYKVKKYPVLIAFTLRGKDAVMSRLEDLRANDIGEWLEKIAKQNKSKRKR